MIICSLLQISIFAMRQTWQKIEYRYLLQVILDNNSVWFQAFQFQKVRDINAQSLNNAAPKIGIRWNKDAKNYQNEFNIINPLTWSITAMVCKSTMLSLTGISIVSCVGIILLLHSDTYSSTFLPFHQLTHLLIEESLTTWCYEP